MLILQNQYNLELVDEEPENCDLTDIKPTLGYKNGDGSLVDDGVVAGIQNIYLLLINVNGSAFFKSSELSFTLKIQLYYECQHYTVLIVT